MRPLKSSSTRKIYVSNTRTLANASFQKLDNSKTWVFKWSGTRKFECSKMRSFKSSSIRKLNFSNTRALENASFRKLEPSKARVFKWSGARKCELSNAPAFENLIFQAFEGSKMLPQELGHSKIDFSNIRALAHASFHKLDHSKTWVFGWSGTRKWALSNARAFEN